MNRKLKPSLEIIEVILSRRQRKLFRDVINGNYFLIDTIEMILNRIVSNLKPLGNFEVYI